MYGVYPRANEIATDVKTITPLYAEVARALSIPEYVIGCGTAARGPRLRIYVRLATIEHHEL